MPDCLGALQGQVDEIIVVDTGSVDESATIASDYGAVVLRHVWDGNFAVPRNLGLDRAKGDWILYIDADEVLRVDGPPLRDRHVSQDILAGRVKFHVHSARTPYAEYRLFRNHPDLRFEGAIHETILPALRRMTGGEGVAVEEMFDVNLYHYGYEGDQTAKHARNLPILLEAIKADPNRPYLRLHAGSIHQDLGNIAEAEANFRRGLSLATRLADQPKFAVEGALCAHGLADVLTARGDTAGALNAIEDGLRLHRDNRSLAWLKARALLARGKFAAAEEIALTRLDEDPGSFFDPALAYPHALFAQDKAMLLGSIYLATKAFEKAAHWFGVVLEYEPDNLEATAKRALACSRVGSGAAEG